MGNVVASSYVLCLLFHIGKFQELFHTEQKYLNVLQNENNIISEGNLSMTEKMFLFSFRIIPDQIYDRSKFKSF